LPAPLPRQYGRPAAAAPAPRSRPTRTRRRVHLPGSHRFPARVVHESRRASSRYPPARPAGRSSRRRFGLAGPHRTTARCAVARHRLATERAGNRTWRPQPAIGDTRPGDTEQVGNAASAPRTPERTAHCAVSVEGVSVSGYMSLVRFWRLLIVVGVSIAAGSCSNGRRAVAPTTSTTAVAASSCRATQLKLGVGSTFGHAGTESQYFSLINTASRSCTLTGYPDVSFVSADGGVVANNFERATTDPAPYPPGQPSCGSCPVTVTPGGIASFEINYGGGGVGCRGEYSWTTIRVSPPNDTGRLSTPFEGSACGGGTVHVVRAGPPPSANG